MTDKRIEDLAKKWESTPDTIRDLRDGTWVKAQPLMFHWMLIRGDWDGCLGNYFDRWCYATKEAAMEALHAFPIDPAADYEPTGWHRHPGTHRRRVNGDPATEYIDP